MEYRRAEGATREHFLAWPPHHAWGSPALVLEQHCDIDLCHALIEFPDDWGCAWLYGKSSIAGDVPASSRWSEAWGMHGECPSPPLAYVPEAPLLVCLLCGLLVLARLGRPKRKAPENGFSGA